MIESYKAASQKYGEFNISIERKDNNAGYSLENCRWANKKEQNNNRRNNRIIEVDNERKTLQEWADETGINRETITRRIDDLHWSVKDTLMTPVLKK
jgi:hypothetical protein